MGKLVRLADWRRKSESASDATQEVIKHLLHKAFPLSGAEAICIYQECIRLDPKCAHAYLNLGMETNRLSEAAQGEAAYTLLKEARKHYRTAIKLDPGVVEAYYNLGCTYIRDKSSAQDDAQAIKYLTKAVELVQDPELKGNALYNLGQVYLHVDKRRAWDCYHRYLKLDQRGEWADNARKILDRISANYPLCAPTERTLTLVK